MSLCPSCKSKIPDSPNFCPSCGRSLECILKSGMNESERYAKI